jgi:hypothetical protein
MPKTKRRTLLVLVALSGCSQRRSEPLPSAARVADMRVYLDPDGGFAEPPIGPATSAVRAQSSQPYQVIDGPNGGRMIRLDDRLQQQMRAQLTDAGADVACERSRP